MEYKRLKDIAKITMGQSPDSSSYNNEKDGLPFFQGNADFGELYPKERFWCNAPKKVAMPGDILISVRAPIGALNYAKGKSCIGRGLAAITIENIVERNYIFHLLKARNNYLNSMGTGSTFKAIGKNVLEEILIPQISREEQQKCVNMMDLLGSIIRERQSQLGKFDEIIKARFVEDFGNPVTNEKGWRKEYLKDVCYKINDGTHFSPESFETGDYKYVTAKNIKIDGFDFSNITYVSGEVHKLIYERCNPEYGDVLYIKDGVTTGTAMVNTLEEEFTLLSSVALLKQDRNIMNGFFLCNLLNNKEMYLDIRRNMGGAAITRLTITKLNEIQIIVPPIQLQNEFANFVKEVNKSKLLAASQPQIHIYKTLTLL